MYNFNLNHFKMSNLVKKQGKRTPGLVFEDKITEKNCKLFSTSFFAEILCSNCKLFDVESIKSDIYGNSPS